MIFFFEGYGILSTILKCFTSASDIDSACITGVVDTCKACITGISSTDEVGDNFGLAGINCSRHSRRGLVQEHKRTVFAYTHGLFIT